jgi:hypothetical protein
VGIVVIGLIVLIGANWVLLWILWRRNVVIQRKLSEPGLVNDEFLRRLANSYSAAKAMLDACPESEVSGPCARRRAGLSVAIAAVDEFASTEGVPPPTDT